MSHQLDELFTHGDASAVEQYLYEHPDFDVNATLGSWKGRPLIWACCNKNSAVVSLMLRHPSIDVNVRGYADHSPFFAACATKRVEPGCLLLADRRVDLNLPDWNGCTPLWAACRHGNLDIIRRMMLSGREIDWEKKGKKHHYGREFTPLEIARDHPYAEDPLTRNAEVVSLLERFRSDPTLTRQQILREMELVHLLPDEPEKSGFFGGNSLL